jgi:hypothetical protein
MNEIMAEYTEACGHGTRIATESNGSIAGVRRVIESDPANPSGLMALSDGRSGEHSQLYSEQIAIVVFNVVVNARSSLPV